MLKCQYQSTTRIAATRGIYLHASLLASCYHISRSKVNYSCQQLQSDQQTVIEARGQE